jgi:outer membrane protein assembly factor BamB
MTCSTLAKHLAGAVSALVLGAVLAPMAPAAAMPVAGISLTPTSGPPMTVVDLMGRGFGPLETVDVRLDAKFVVAATAGPSGSLRTETRMPPAAAQGAHTFTATGERTKRSAAATFTVRTDWKQFGFDAERSGSNPYEDVLSPQTALTLQPGCSSQAGGAVDTSFVEASGGVWFAADDGTVHAIDEQTCKTLWVRSTGAPVHATPAIDSGILFVPSEDGRVYAFNAASGDRLWSIKLGAPIDQSPIVFGGRLFVVANDGTVRAMDEQTGRPLWAAGVGGSPIGLVLAKGWPCCGRPSTETGQTGLFAAPEPGPLGLFVGTSSGHLIGFALQSGQTRFESILPYLMTAMAADPTGTVVYTGGADGTLTAFAPSQSESPQWTGPVTKSAVRGIAATDGGVWIGSGDGHVIALSPKGAVQWAVTVDGALVNTPVIVNGLVVLESDAGFLDCNGVVLDATSGAELWEWMAIGSASTPIVANGRAWFGWGDGSVTSFLPGQAVSGE